MIETISYKEMKFHNPKENDRVIKLKKYQDKFIFSEKRFPALVAAWGTGKTMCGIERIRLHSELYPNNLILVIRKEFTDLKDSTIKDFELYTGMKINSSRDAVFPNGSIIMFRHGEELHGDNLNNMNLGGFLIEQGEEYLTDDVFFKLNGRLRRAGFPHFGAVIANTRGHNWMYKLWKSSPAKEFDLSEATTYDNADILPKDFIDSLLVVKEKKSSVYNRFVLNSWEEDDVTDVVIKPEWVRSCIGISIPHSPTDIRRVIAIDVARMGNDKTVFYAMENYRVVAKEVHQKIDTMTCVGRALLFASKNLATNNFAIDEIGVGEGVGDRMRELGKFVVEIRGSERKDKRYFNTRSMIYEICSEMVFNRQVPIPENDIDLIEQLSWAKYKEIKSNGVYQVEPKADIKDRYGASPDDADAWMYGIYATSLVPKIFVDPREQNRNTNWVGGAYVPEPAIY